MSLFKKAMLAVATMVLALVTIVAPANKATKVEAASITTGTTLYLKAGPWDVDGARFAAYFYNSSTNTWASMETEDVGIYKVSAPSGTWTNVIFCRMNGTTTANSWDNKWNQTGNLTYDGTKNLFTVTTWDNQTTGWSTYTPSVPGDKVVGVLGVINGVTNWNTDTDMEWNETTERYEVELDLIVGDQFKIRLDDAWTTSYGYTASGLDSNVKNYAKSTSDGNIEVVVAGTYVIWFTDDAKLGMDPVWKLSVNIGYQVGTKDEAKALRLVAEFNLDAETIQTFESTVQWRVTFNEKADTRDVTTLYSSVNPMNGEEVLTGAYYAVLTYVNVPAGDYTVELLVDGVAVTSVVATVA